MGLSRRDLLKLGAGGALAAAWPPGARAAARPAPPSPESAAWAARPLPPDAEAEIRVALARYRAWKGTDETVVFPIATDLHDGAPDIADPPDWTQPKMHLLFAARAAALFGADFLAELGDIGEDRDLDWKPVDLPVAERRYRSQEILLGASPVPVLACIGNHDLSSAKFALPSSSFGRRFIGAQKARGVPFVTGPDEDYGYLDLPAKRVRAIFLNTADLNAHNTARREWCGISDAQVAFVAKALDGLPPDWAAVVLSHIPLCAGLGRVIGARPNGEDRMKNRAETLAAVEAFVRKGGRCLGVFSGHAHQDWDARENGVTHVVSQGCGTCPYTWLLPEARYTHRGEPGGAMIVDVVALKPAQGVGRVFRIGAGGAAFDRPFPHPAYGASEVALHGNRVRITCPSWLHPLSFTLRGADMAGKGAFASEVRDRVRFVHLDIAAGWTRAEALAFLKDETAKGDLTAVVLNRPVWTPGRDDVAFGNPAVRPPSAWRNFELRDWIFRRTPNLLAVFALDAGYSLSTLHGRAQVTCPRDGALTVAVN